MGDPHLPFVQRDHSLPQYIRAAERAARIPERPATEEELAAAQARLMDPGLWEDGGFPWVRRCGGGSRREYVPLGHVIVELFDGIPHGWVVFRHENTGHEGYRTFLVVLALPIRQDIRVERL